MDGPRHQFLAGATLALHQHRAVGGGHGADNLFQSLDGRAAANDVIQRIVAGRVASQGKVLPPQRLRL